jgi:hypothetical protein
MMVRLPSNRSLTPTASKSSAALNLFWGGVVCPLAEWNPSGQSRLSEAPPRREPSNFAVIYRSWADAAQSASFPLID